MAALWLAVPSSSSTALPHPILQKHWGSSGTGSILQPVTAQRLPSRLWCSWAFCFGARSSSLGFSELQSQASSPLGRGDGLWPHKTGGSCYKLVVWVLFRQPKTRESNTVILWCHGLTRFIHVYRLCWVLDDIQDKNEPRLLNLQCRQHMTLLPSLCIVHILGL